MNQARHRTLPSSSFFSARRKASSGTQLCSVVGMGSSTHAFGERRDTNIVNWFSVFPGVLRVKIGDDKLGEFDSQRRSIASSLGIQEDEVHTVALESIGIDEDEWITLLEMETRKKKTKLGRTRGYCFTAVLTTDVSSRGVARL